MLRLMQFLSCCDKYRDRWHVGISKNALLKLIYNFLVGVIAIVLLISTPPLNAHGAAYCCGYSDDSRPDYQHSCWVTFDVACGAGCSPGVCCNGYLFPVTCP